MCAVIIWNTCKVGNTSDSEVLRRQISAPRFISFNKNNQRQHTHSSSHMCTKHGFTSHLLRSISDISLNSSFCIYTLFSNMRQESHMENISASTLHVWTRVRRGVSCVFSSTFVGICGRKVHRNMPVHGLINLNISCTFLSSSLHHISVGKLLTLWYMRPQDCSRWGVWLGWYNRQMVPRRKSSCGAEE